MRRINITYDMTYRFQNLRAHVSLLMVASVCLMFSGCSSLWGKSRWDTEEAAFAKTEAAIAAPKEVNVTSMHKSNLYTRPVVQRIKVPAMIRGGVYIPEHWEYVIIKPGEYVLDSPEARQSNDDPPRRRADTPEKSSPARAAMSMKELKRIYGIPDNVLPVLLAKDDGDVFIIPYRVGVNGVVDDIANVNVMKVKHLLTDEVLSAPFIVSADQQIEIGNASYTFSCSTAGVSVLHFANGRAASIRVPDGDAYLTSDGYVIRVACLKGRVS